MENEKCYILSKYAEFWNLGPFNVPFRNKIANLLINNPQDTKMDCKLGGKKQVSTQVYVTLKILAILLRDLELLASQDC
jgi:hypothetical protein